MANVYERLWNPREYLQQYYTADYVTDDEKANFCALIRWLQQRQHPFRRAIDVGCGCTVHHVIPLVPYVSEIHLADYLPDNLAEVKKWLDDAPDAHNWEVYLREVLALESSEQVSRRSIEERTHALRCHITTLMRADIRQHHPLGNGATYDLVTSFYCAEAVATSHAEWHDMMGNLCRLVAPGGTLFLTAMRQCHFYKIIEKRFPAVFIDEADLASVLQHNGFDTAHTDIEVVHIAEWVDEGFDSICIVKAEKPTLT